MTKPRKKQKIPLLLSNSYLDCTGIWRTQDCLRVKRKLRTHLRPYKAPCINSFKNLVKRFVIENLKENRTAENRCGSAAVAKSCYSQQSI